jgi:hypothetical protein
MFTGMDKALAAFFTALVALLATFNIDLGAWAKDGTTVSVLAALITSIVVYYVPNKPGEPAPPPPPPTPAGTALQPDDPGTSRVF